jgi:hypothetical protein
MAERNTDELHEVQLQGGSDAGGVGRYLLHRAKPHLPPWLGMAATGLAGALGHWRWSESAAAGVGLTLASVGLTGATWLMGKSTSQQRRLHSAITVAAGSAWLTAACLAGPTTGPIDDLYLMGGPVVALSWNVRMVLRRNPDPTGESTDKGLLAKVGLARAQVGTVKVEPNRVTAPLALEAGEQTHDDVTKSLSRLASALDLPRNAVRYRPDPGSERRGELVIVPEDMLTDVVEWDGPSNLGGSIADPIVIGRYDDGSPMYLYLPGDPEANRNATHLLIAGGTGSGKGDTALNVQTEILSRTDVMLWLSDPKMFQDFRPLLPGIDWAAEGGSPTEVMVADPGGHPGTYRLARPARLPPVDPGSSAGTEQHRSHLPPRRPPLWVRGHALPGRLDGRGRQHPPQPGRRRLHRHRTGSAVGGYLADRLPSATFLRPDVHQHPRLAHVCDRARL